MHRSLHGLQVLFKVAESPDGLTDFAGTASGAGKTSCSNNVCALTFSISAVPARVEVFSGQ